MESCCSPRARRDRNEGRSTPRSDYDLGLFAKRPIELAVLSQIRAELEGLRILQRVDLVDLHMSPQDLIQSVLEGGELLDER